MKIKRFNENTNEKLSNSRVNEIIEELKDFLAIIDSKKDVITGLLNELDKYEVKDSISSLQEIDKSLITTSDKLDTIITDLENYKKDYLFSENK